ncbi:PhoH family protein [Paenibacillus doosanensis]|uniref:PhoH family protein n=1 Tax=Paenibacillus doosanensis TaxID=1229154 RepID=UPI002180413B|nr:PhoH family protein [Paenibacillus doosanensis]MCS7461681.1 PhoH family protein [Paenibacillus doosanensis]
MDAIELLQGAYDLHVHSGPDILDRKVDDLEMAERLATLGMKGYGIKSHYFCTAERAKIINKLHPGFHAVGAVALNHSIGGLNPLAVEMAARGGAKIVWMPTFDAANEQEHFHKNKPEKLPHWAKLQMELIAQGKTQSSISVLENGKLKAVVHDILDAIAQHDLVLATGHLGIGEIYAVVKAAKQHKVRKIVITHPNFPSIRLSKEQQKELTGLGARMEFCFTTPHSGKTTWDEVYEQIRYVDPANCIISTDLGQPNGPYPDEGLRIFVANLLANGFTVPEIKQMTAVNTAFLVES